MKHTGVFIESVPKDELLALEYKWNSLQNNQNKIFFFKKLWEQNLIIFFSSPL